VDIKGFFDNISHSIMMTLLGQHTQEKWVLLYVERLLKAGVEQEDGSVIARTKGTPQGGVMSHLLANLTCITLLTRGWTKCTDNVHLNGTLMIW